MEDFEVRQALAIIKDRVNEMKKDDDWKARIAKEWNEAADEEAQESHPMAKRRVDDDQKSAVSY